MKKITVLLFISSLLLIPEFIFAQSDEDLPLLRQHLNARIMEDGFPVYYYHNKPFSGFTQNITKNGFCREFLFENGVMQKEISYYVNGNIEREFTYYNGKRHGKYIGYFEDGKTKMFETNYVNGIMDGMQYGWNKDGTLRYEEQRMDGVILMQIEYENKDDLPMNMDGC